VGISMNFVELMIGEKLKEADPALDIMGSDRKVLQVACQDFTNYLKFHWNLMGKESNQCELVEKLENLFKEDSSELDAFLDNLDWHLVQEMERACQAAYRRPKC
jgi:mevalonate kinase